jgi:hypothetical protein
MSRRTKRGVDAQFRVLDELELLRTGVGRGANVQLDMLARQSLAVMLGEAAECAVLDAGRDCKGRGRRRDEIPKRKPGHGDNTNERDKRP